MTRNHYSKDYKDYKANEFQWWGKINGLMGLGRAKLWCVILKVLVLQKYKFFYETIGFNLVGCFENTQQLALGAENVHGREETIPKWTLQIWKYMRSEIDRRIRAPMTLRRSSESSHQRCKKTLQWETKRIFRVTHDLLSFWGGKNESKESLLKTKNKKIPVFYEVSWSKIPDLEEPSEEKDNTSEFVRSRGTWRQAKF